MNVIELIDEINTLLECSDFKDVSYNGLQVQADFQSLSSREIGVICTSTDASLAAIKQARELHADLLLVHHGLYWRGADPRAVGPAGARLKAALQGDGLNIAAFHLPLDASMRFGNNANLCRLLQARSFDYQIPGDKTSIAMICDFAVPRSLDELCRTLQRELVSRVQLLGAYELNEAALQRQCISRALICSGSGSSLLEHELQPDFDVLITGDVSEQIYQLAAEFHTPVIAAGHHATEQSGVKALGDFLAAEHGIRHYHLSFNLEQMCRYY